jgi:iron complex transport system ATP-binding protein
MLQANHICVKVGDNTLLDDAELKVDCGQLHVVIGPNGAGKSTLLKALCEDVPLDQGKICYQHKCVSDYESKELAQIRAVLTQNYDCDFPFTVQEIVDMSHFVHHDRVPYHQLLSYSKQAIEMLNVTKLAKKPFTLLSGGEKQRVQFARVLCQLLPALTHKKPCYLLIDEPTASLDLYHQYQVMKLARDIANQGAAVIAVVHDLALAASFADEITMLEKGKVAAMGKPSEILNRDQLQKTYQIDAQLSQHTEYLPSLNIALSAVQ